MSRLSGTEVDFACGDIRVRLSLAEEGWVLPNGSHACAVLTAARCVRKLLGLNAPIPHDSKNILVQSNFGLGTITSRGYPPQEWQYVHGRELVSERSAAKTLSNAESVRSLDTTLAGCLARVQVLAQHKAKPAHWSGSRLCSSYKGKALIEDPERRRALENELATRLGSVADPSAEVAVIVKELRGLGHRLHLYDEDGGQWQLWVSSDLHIHFSYPDLEALDNGDVPELCESDSAFDVACRVSVDVVSAKSTGAKEGYTDCFE